MTIAMAAVHIDPCCGSDPRAGTGGDADPVRPGSPTPGGRLREQALDPSDRSCGIALHLSLLAALIFAPLGFLAPLTLWLIRKDASRFVDDHGREVLNFAISFTILNFVLILTVIGAVLVPVLWIVGLVNLIRGSMAASKAEYFRYPITIRFL